MPVRLRLVLASCLMLFLELALIRWTGANVLHLSYFSNIVLLGSFLGLGLGFLRSRPDRRPPLYFPVALALLMAFVLFVPVTIDRAGSDLVFFTSLTTTGPPVWVVLPLVFSLTAVIMAGPAELVAACFRELPRLEAYRWDLVGSLVGIGAFTLLSFLRAPSVAWGVIVAVLLVVLMARRPAALLPRLAVVAAAVAIVGFLGYESTRPGVSWSPYYKVETAPGEIGGVDLVTILANGVPHQAIGPSAQRLEASPWYSLPYERTTRTGPGDVLIVGAGNGVDVALALERGATSVDAVEIDPRIAQLGRELNPDRPYDDPRVSAYVDDGRAFLQRTDRTYDTIIFALPDSLTLVSGASALRLESYLFTVEAMEQVREKLRPAGAFAMYNAYREDWLVGRLGSTVGQAFGHAPCVDLLSSGKDAVIVAAVDEADQRCGTDPVANAAVSGADPVSDARPFVYLREPSIPPMYLFTLIGLLALSLLAVRVVSGPVRRMRPYTDLFLLGAAFMLLETRSVTGFALLFGTTWVVNAVVFAGVLVAVLLAVETTRRLPKAPPPVVSYGLLAASLAIAALVPASWLLSLPAAPRAIVAVTVAFLPIFTANVVFASRFAATADATTAFGANLLGAMVGGALEYLALLVGYPALLALAALLYLAAFVTGRRSPVGSGQGAPAEVLPAPAATSP